VLVVPMTLVLQVSKGSQCTSNTFDSHHFVSCVLWPCEVNLVREDTIGITYTLSFSFSADPAAGGSRCPCSYSYDLAYRAVTDPFLCEFIFLNGFVFRLCPALEGMDTLQSVIEFEDENSRNLWRPLKMPHRHFHSPILLKHTQTTPSPTQTDSPAQSQYSSSGSSAASSPDAADGPQSSPGP
jgi:hypothetical protein